MLGLGLRLIYPLQQWLTASLTPKRQQKWQQQQQQQHQHQLQQRQTKQSGKKKPNGVEMHEVIASIESLYRDELKPYGRLLRKRVMERAEARGSRVSKRAIEQLRTTCDSSSWLSVQAEEGGDWSVLIRGQPECFVEIHSPEDRYPTKLWMEAEAYFGSMADDTALPGGRYSCAQTLMSRQLSFLSGLSLGSVCHFVQLAISEKKILGHLNGAIVPYSRSMSKAKEMRAQGLQPMETSEEGVAMATWESLRPCLLTIFSDHQPEDAPIALANLKRVIRLRCNIDLSETALGYAKLSEMLQDERVQDLCMVKLADQGYVLFPRKQQMVPYTIRLEDHMAKTPFSSEGGKVGSQENLQTGSPQMKLVGNSVLGQTTSMSMLAESCEAPLSSPSLQGSNAEHSGAVSSLEFPPTPSPWSPCTLVSSPTGAFSAPPRRSRMAPPRLSTLAVSTEDVAGDAVADQESMPMEVSEALVCPSTPSPWSPCALDLQPPCAGFAANRRCLGAAFGPPTLQEDILEDVERVDLSEKVGSPMAAVDMFLCPPTPTPWSPFVGDVQRLPTLLKSQGQMLQSPHASTCKSSSHSPGLSTQGSGPLWQAGQSWQLSTPSSQCSGLSSQGSGPLWQAQRAGTPASRASMSDGRMLKRANPQIGRDHAADVFTSEGQLERDVGAWSDDNGSFGDASLLALTRVGSEEALSLGDASLPVIQHVGSESGCSDGDKSSHTHQARRLDDGASLGNSDIFALPLVRYSVQNTFIECADESPCSLSLPPLERSMSF